jgi:membrane-bound metal-dependent hydrolase YbcI (DUF457 family)
MSVLFLLAVTVFILPAFYFDSRSSRDLRTSHFMATHTIQFLPLLGLLLGHWKIPVRGIIAVSGLALSVVCIVLLRIAQCDNLCSRLRGPGAGVFRHDLCFYDEIELSYCHIKLGL